MVDKILITNIEKESESIIKNYENTINLLQSKKAEEIKKFDSLIEKTKEAITREKERNNSFRKVLSVDSKESKAKKRVHKKEVQKPSEEKIEFEEK